MNEDFLPIEMEKLVESTGNVYKSVAIVARRADQLTLELKEELQKKLAEFAPAHDNLEEIMENREQIEISRYYERKPKPTQEATESFLEGGVYFRGAEDIGHMPAE